MSRSSTTRVLPWLLALGLLLAGTLALALLGGGRDGRQPDPEGSVVREPSATEGELVGTDTTPEPSASEERVELPPPEPEEPPTYAGPRGRVHLRVTDAGGAPIEGARVRAGPPTALPLDALEAHGVRFAEERTDAEGRAAFAELAAGRVSLLVRASGYAPLETRELVVGPGERYDLGTLVLERAVRLEGSVVDSLDRPVVDARLRVAFGEPSTSVAERAPAGVSDEDGRFVLDQVPVGPWTLHASHSEHPPETLRGTTSTPEDEIEELRLVLRDAAAIEGRVLGAPAHELANLEVVARTEVLGDEHEPLAVVERRVRVAKEGVFAMRGLAPDERYVLELVPRDGDGGLRANEVVAAAPAHDVLLEWTPSVTARLRVLGVGREAPLERLYHEARLDDELLHAYGDGPGKYPGGTLVLSELRPATRESKLYLTVGAVGHEPVEVLPRALPPSGDLDLGTVSLPARPSVRVRAVEAASGEPVVGARVSLRAVGRNVVPLERAIHAGTTDEGGWVTLDLPPTTNTKLVVRAEGFRPYGEERPTAASDGPWTAELSPGGSLDVTVLDALRTPVAGALLQVDRGTLRWPTGSDGRARIEDLSQGMHEVRCVPWGEGRAMVRTEAWRREHEARDRNRSAEPSVQVELAEGEHREVVLVRGPRARLLGRVTRGEDSLVGAHVLLAEGRDFGAVAEAVEPSGAGVRGGLRTDADGRFVADGLVPGEWGVFVRHPSLSQVARFRVEVEARDHDEEFEIPERTIVGAVFDEDGVPIAGALVDVTTNRDVPIPREWRDADHVPPPPRPSVRSDARGRYRLEGVRPDEIVRVRARAAGFVTSTSEDLPAQPSGGAEQEVELRLLRAGSLRIRLQLESEEPYEGRGKLALQLQDPDFRRMVEHVREVETSGAVVLVEDLLPGVHRIEGDRRFRIGSTEAEVVAGETREVVLTVR